MRGNMRWALFLALLSALLCAGPSLCYPQSTEQPISKQSDKQIIERLLTDLTQSLQAAKSIQINSTLQTATYDQQMILYKKLEEKLPGYEATIKRLSDSLDKSDSSLQSTKDDLSKAISSSEDLKQQLQMASTALSNYKTDTDNEVAALRLSSQGWKVAGITFGIIALGEGVYIIGHALGAWK
jgi:hypothetical protein